MRTDHRGTRMYCFQQKAPEKPNTSVDMKNPSKLNSFENKLDKET